MLSKKLVGPLGVLAAIALTPMARRARLARDGDQRAHRRRAGRPGGQPNRRGGRHHRDPDQRRPARRASRRTDTSTRAAPATTTAARFAHLRGRRDACIAINQSIRTRSSRRTPSAPVYALARSGQRQDRASSARRVPRMQALLIRVPLPGAPPARSGRGAKPADLSRSIRRRRPGRSRPLIASLGVGHELSPARTGERINAQGRVVRVGPYVAHSNPRHQDVSPMVRSDSLTLPPIEYTSGRVAPDP